MKLLIRPQDLKKEFKRLIKKYNTFHWAAAWASAGNEVFEELLDNRYKIEKITVGIHFYQTHPNFIKEFIEDETVHFLEQPEGTFHPKIYLFSNDGNDWELIIGSANFTASAFSKNTEVCVLMNTKDNNAEEVYKTALQVIDTSFEQGKTFDQVDWENYNKVWNIQQPKIQSLSGQYGRPKDKPKPIHQIESQTRSWDEFIDKVSDEGTNVIKIRLRVIKIAQELFAKKAQFKDLTEDERKFIAGIPNRLGDYIKGAENWPYFGSMKGAGKFKNKIKDNNEFISQALDEIPLNGTITKTNYDRFLEYFQLALPGDYLATSTRLLAMKRPDVFICYDSKNNNALCRDFGITRNGMNHERYWNEIILRISDSDWYQKPTPKNEMERKISLARSAFLDSLYYNE
ncbi:restriction endonuclease PLD domain-containing protein [Chryseobacterium sp. NFX27]|uniref:restriction endonuclease PLD domain-containing protein n=1 Tax=Chryseobacterium sp. NFX27 TaxID=2819618 RepID=UPI003CE6D432